MKFIHINLHDESLELKAATTNIFNRAYEIKILLHELTAVNVNSSIKKIINKARSVAINSKHPNLVEKEYIPFILVYSTGSLEFVAENYHIYAEFNYAIENLIKYKSELSSILKKIEKIEMINNANSTY